MTARRTYWHLERLGRRPSDYEVATSKLLYHPERGFAIRTALTEYHERHDARAGFVHGDWESFDDPRALTYSKYVAERRDREVFVNGLFASAETLGDDMRLGEEWVRELARVFAPLRFPAHALQMVSAYTGSLAPSGKLVVLWAFQAADEMRLVQRVVYRTKQLEARRPKIFQESRAIWQEDAAWQPLRELVERLLVVRDFSEIFVASSLVVKPAFDELFLRHLGERARTNGDVVLERMLGSLQEDAIWHREWAHALSLRLSNANEADATRIRSVIEHWWPLTERAIRALAPLCAKDGAGCGVAEHVVTSTRAGCAAAKVEPGREGEKNHEE